MKMLKKCIFFIAVAIVLLTAPAAQNSFASTEGIDVFVDGKEVIFDAPPFIEGDHVLVPVRSIAEALDFDVEWLPNLNCVIIKSKPGKPEKSIDIFIGEYYALVDNRGINLDSPAKISGDRTFVPLRFVSENMGADVVWNGKTHTVQITNTLHSPLLKGKTADTVFSILDGRFSIKMPGGSSNEAAGYGGIMGSAADSSEETHISISAQDQEFKVYAQELFRYGSGNLLKDAGMFINENNNGDPNFTLSDVVRVADLEYVAITPIEIRVRDSTLVKGALVKLADNTLVYMGIYANAWALTYMEDCVAMADSVLESIECGTRLLNAEPKTVRLYGYSLKLEKGYVYSTRLGPDFDVCYFYKLVPMDVEQPTFGIYSGGFPSKFGSTLPVHEQKNDLILGRDVIWDIYSNKKGAVDKDTFIETLIEDDGWYRHIFIHPKSKSELEIIEKAIHSIS